uniref:Uncharacterized protein n=1 Tax=Amphora coffeiformis TaxID=265554 RepID=A0A7S3L7Z3_9STRA|eukprot:scaffold2452_cov194-Amphora_coffeaeformis.AAC.5
MEIVVVVDDQHGPATTMASDHHLLDTTERPQQRVIGGTKGHMEETIHPEQHRVWLHLFGSFRWKMIQKCTGRYTCHDHAQVSHLSPLELLASVGITTTTFSLYTFQLHGRPDHILVVPLDEVHETGLITYVKTTSGEDCNDPSYVHTLNSPSGFQRKLEAIGIYNLSSCDEKRVWTTTDDNND